jgi:hypothetical protein
MAKITTRNYDELIVSEEKAYEIRELVDVAKKEFLAGGLNLNMRPLFIDTIDGTWSGTLADIGTISDSNKIVRRVGRFKSMETLEEFHAKHGYLSKTSKYEKGYGLLDVKTQFMIETKIAKIVDNGLGKKQLFLIEWKDKEKLKYWSDLWEIYTENLDEFSELLPVDKRHLS